MNSLPSPFIFLTHRPHLGAEQGSAFSFLYHLCILPWQFTCKSPRQSRRVTSPVTAGSLLPRIPHLFKVSQGAVTVLRYLVVTIQLPIPSYLLNPRCRVFTPFCLHTESAIRCYVNPFFQKPPAVEKNRYVDSSTPVTSTGRLKPERTHRHSVQERMALKAKAIKTKAIRSFK